MSRVAVVTGAARGIGAATVRGLAAAGWSVVAADRGSDDSRLPYPMGTAAELDAVVAEALDLQSEPAGTAPPGGGRIVARRADATDPDALGAVVAETESKVKVTAL